MKRMIPILLLIAVGFNYALESSEIDEEDTLRARIEKLFEDASLWEVGENVAKVKEAREALREIGFPALQYVLTEKIGTDKTLEIRAIKDLVKAMPRESKPLLYDALEDEKDTVRSNAIYLIGEIRDTQALPMLFKHLREEESYKLKARIIGALGKIGDTVSVDSVIPYLSYPWERVRIRAADALGKLKAQGAVGPLVSSLKDTFFTVRYASGKALSLISPPPVDTLLTLFEEGLKKNDIALVGHLIRILGDIGDTLFKKDSLDQRVLKIRLRVVPLLLDSNWTIRAQAVDVLNKVPTEGLYLRFKLLLDEEKHPLVRNRLKLALGIQ